MREILEIMAISPVIPVATIPDGADAAGVARALKLGGVGIIEVTLRTPAAMDAITRMRDEVDGMCVGAGTVWTTKQAEDVIAAGAQFIVSPGISLDVYDVCVEAGVPILPGAQTTSEIAFWVQQGLSAVKFFPAAVAGGVAALKSFAAVFPETKFCPTGGISAANARSYLDLECVPCVGGSWLLDKKDVLASDWDAIGKLAREAAALARL